MRSGMNLSKFGIGLGENPDMNNPFVRAAAETIEEGCHLALALVAAGVTEIDLREWRNTPAGGCWDGGKTTIESAEQIAAWMIGWNRPRVAFERARKILETRHA